MAEKTPARRGVARITCSVHHSLSASIERAIADLGLHHATVEDGRSVRQLFRDRLFRIAGQVVTLEDAAVAVFRVVVSREHADAVCATFVRAGDLTTPGRGSIFVQHVDEYAFDANGCLDEAADDTEATVGKAIPGTATSDTAAPAGRVPSTVLTVKDATWTPLRGLAVITAILSVAGSGETIAGHALELGTCVPLVTLGLGTGLRDRLGLLRITIPPEKELVHLLVPTQDVESIMRLLIEAGRLDRPGRGFLYSTPVDAAVVDTRLRLGRQEHAASIEQIIAAIDELKAGTAWRRRATALEAGATTRAVRLTRQHHEIAVVYPEGTGEPLIAAALEAGAAGATTARVRRVALESSDVGGAALERCTIVVDARVYAQVLEALLAAASTGRCDALAVQVTRAPLVFTHGA